MADITFWKLQRTDQFGMPGVTRYRLVTGAKREKQKDDPEQAWWTFESRDPKELSPKDHIRGCEVSRLAANGRRA
jgi:hypothetical protein